MKKAEGVGDQLMRERRGVTGDRQVPVIGLQSTGGHIYSHCLTQQSTSILYLVSVVVFVWEWEG